MTNAKFLHTSFYQLMKFSSTISFSVCNFVEIKTVLLFSTLHFFFT